MRHSESLARFEAREYFVTVGSWDSGYGPTYEVGIREKERPDKFSLIQGGWLGKDEAKMAGEAIAKLLDSGFMPNGLRQIFRG